MAVGMMSGKNAARVADWSYVLAGATASGPGRGSVASRATALAQDKEIETAPAAEGQPEVSITPLEALTASSGAFRLKEEAGFAALLERNVGLKRDFIFAMRGTVTKKDWLSNLNIGVTRGPTESGVHAGFMEIFTQMEDDITRLIADAQPARMHFVGHSLGGALATLAALNFAKNTDTPTFLYTFGAPRIGGGALGRDLARHIGVDHIKRVYNLSDPVPLIPLYPYLHPGMGTVQLPDNFGRVTTAAHSMGGFYVPAMPSRGWPATMPANNNRNPDYWLRQAEQANSFGAKMGFYFLGQALDTMLPTIRLVTGMAIGAGLTVLDYLAQALTMAARIAREVGDMILRFVRAAMRYALGTVKAGLSLADLTESFLRWVLSLLFEPVKMAARGAIAALRS